MMYEFLLMKSWYTGNQRIKIAMHIPLAEDIFLTLEADGVRVEIVIPAVKEILLQNGTVIHMMWMIMMIRMILPVNGKMNLKMDMMMLMIIGKRSMIKN